MISFREYLQQEMNKTTDNMVVATVVVPVKKEDSFEDIFDSIDPNVWTAKAINNQKYLFFNEKFINITKLKEEINKLYTEKGYTGYGFSKLDEGDLVRYTTVKNILINQFNSYTESDEIPAEKLATIFFMKELKNFDWTPEEY